MTSILSSSVAVDVSSSTLSLLIPTLRHTIGSTVIPGDRIGRMIVESISNSKEKILLIAGPGTYLRDGQIYASILGQLQSSIGESLSDTISKNSTNNNGNNPKSSSTTNVVDYSSLGVVVSMILSVQPQKGYFAQEDVIQVGQIILGRITRIQSQQQQAVVSILAIQTNHLNSSSSTVVEDVVVCNEDKGQHMNNNKRERFFIPPYNPEGIIRKDDIRTNIIDQQGVIQIQNSFHYNDLILAKVISLGIQKQYFLSTAETYLGVIHAKSTISGQSMIPISYKEMECPETGMKELRKCAKPPT